MKQSVSVFYCDVRDDVLYITVRESLIYIWSKNTCVLNGVVKYVWFLCPDIFI